MLLPAMGIIPPPQLTPTTGIDCLPPILLDQPATLSCQKTLPRRRIQQCHRLAPLTRRTGPNQRSSSLLGSAAGVQVNFPCQRLHQLLPYSRKYHLPRQAQQLGSETLIRWLPWARPVLPRESRLWVVPPVVELSCRRCVVPPSVLVAAGLEGRHAAQAGVGG